VRFTGVCAHLPIRLFARSYFESYEEEATGLPVLRVLKELVHCS
jgi:hypothetical protein